MNKISPFHIVMLLVTLGFIKYSHAENETGLRVVRGVITNYSKFDPKAGVGNPVIQSGNGFKLRGNSDSDRKMQITFDQPFNDIPAITVTSNIFGDCYREGDGIFNQSCMIWNDDTPNKGDLRKNFWVRCESYKSMATQISFIAIGK